MAFDILGQNSLQDDEGLTREEYLNFKPTLSNGKQFEPSRQFNIPTPEQVLSSARTGQPLPALTSNSPFTLGSPLADSLTFNGIDVNEARNAVELDNPTSLASDVKKSRFESIMDYISHNVKPAGREMYHDAKRVEGNFRSLNVQNMGQNLTRYEMSGKDVNKIPFNPYNDNEKLYRERMSLWQDTKRAFGGMLKTAGLGFSDSLYMGKMIDTDAASVFEAANKLGGSSREDIFGKVNNLWVSAGYTVGILAEIGVESMAILGLETLAGLTTPMTGGASIAAGITGGTAMAADVAKKSSNLLKAIKSLSKSQTWKNMAKSSVSAINPLDDVIKFNKSTQIGGTLSGASKAQKMAGYATSAWRGYNKIKFAYEEAALEAGTTFLETRDQALNEYYAEHGRMPSLEETKKIVDLSQAMAMNTFKANLPTIYLSNAFVFDSLLRPNKFRFVKGIGKASGAKNQILFKRGVLDDGKKVYQAVAAPKDFWGKVKLGMQDKKLGMMMLTQGAKAYTAENTVEGLQEVFQDLFQTASKAQFNDIYNGNEKNGAYYNYLLSNFDSIFSEQGLDAFVSGFVMQMMVSPVAKMSSFMAGNKDAYKDGFISSTLAKPFEFVGDKVRSFTNKDIKAAGGIEEYNKQQEQKKKEEWQAAHPGEDYDKAHVTDDQQLQKDIDLLNDFFKDPVKYANPIFNRAMETRDYTEYEKFLQSDNNKSGFIDVRKEDRFNQIMTILNYGGFEKFNEAMDDLVRNTTQEEFDKNNYGITYDEYLENVEATRQYAKNLQTKKDNLDSVFENPFHLEYYRGKTDTPEYYEAAAGWVAYEYAKRDILFQQQLVEDSIQRADSITTNMGKRFETSKIPFQDVKVLLSTAAKESSDLEDRIANLDREVKQFEGTFADSQDENMKRQYTFKKNILEQLRKISGLIEKTSADVAVDSNADVTELSKAITEYLNTLSVEYKTDAFTSMKISSEIDEITRDIIDARNLTVRSRMVAKSVNMLLDPKGFAQSYENHKKWFKDIHEHRNEEIGKALSAFRQQMEYDDMMQKLHALGVFFLPEDKDKLVNENKIPTLYQFMNNDSEFIDEVNITSEEYQKAIEVIMEYFPQAKGATIYNGEFVEEVDSTRKIDDERSLADILKEYDIDLSKGSITMPINELLDKIAHKAHPDTEERMVALANALKNKLNDIQVIVSKDSPSAIIVNQDEGKIIIDPRYASNEYRNSYMNFEDLVLRAALSRVVSDYVKENPELANKLDELRKDFLSYIEVISRSESFKHLRPFTTIDNPVVFAVKALTDARFGGMLASIVASPTVSTVSGNSLWKKFVASVKQAFNDQPNSVLNAIQENLSEIFHQEIEIPKFNLENSKKDEDKTQKTIDDIDQDTFDELVEKDEQEDEETGNDQNLTKEERANRQLNKQKDDPDVNDIVNKGNLEKIAIKPNKRTSKHADVKLKKLSGEKFNVNPDTMNGILITDTNGHSIFNAMGRTFVLCDVNGIVIPFYQSSRGTSGKIKGNWYPFFGYTGNWLIKGGIDENGKMSYSPEIDRITELLNKDFKIPTDFDNNGVSKSTNINVQDLGLNMYTVYDRFGEEMKKLGTNDPDERVFYDNDNKELTNADALFVKEITGIKTQGFHQSHASQSFIRPFIDSEKKELNILEVMLADFQTYGVFDDDNKAIYQESNAWASKQGIMNENKDFFSVSNKEVREHDPSTQTQVAYTIPFFVSNALDFMSVQHPEKMVGLFYALFDALKNVRDVNVSDLRKQVLNFCDGIIPPPVNVILEEIEKTGEAAKEDQVVEQDQDASTNVRNIIDQMNIGNTLIINDEKYLFKSFDSDKGIYLFEHNNKKVEFTYNELFNILSNSSSTRLDDDTVMDTIFEMADNGDVEDIKKEQDSLDDYATDEDYYDDVDYSSEMTTNDGIIIEGDEEDTFFRLKPTVANFIKAHEKGYLELQNCDIEDIKRCPDDIILQTNFVISQRPIFNRGNKQITGKQIIEYKDLNC